MKTEDEIIRAHDTLVSVIRGETPEVTFGDPISENVMIGAADVLCWLLDHGHNQGFQKNLDKLRTVLAGFGYVQMPLDSDPDEVNQSGPREV